SRSPGAPPSASGSARPCPSGPTARSRWSRARGRSGAAGPRLADAPMDGTRGAPTTFRRGWTDAGSWRGARAGLWAWLLQRTAAIALLGVVALHLRNPFVRTVQALLLGLVLLHALLGVRAILLDVGLPRSEEHTSELQSRQYLV